jgi:hypothetical protein
MMRSTENAVMRPSTEQFQQIVADIGKLNSHGDTSQIRAAFRELGPYHAEQAIYQLLAAEREPP